MEDANFGNELGLDTHFPLFSADHITRSGVNRRETDILEAGLLPERE